ncbi:hypothetical protein CR513_21074, partial [Mucuna pruriens]
MEITIIKVEVVKSQDTKMARFLHGLNRTIQDIVELHHYTSLATLVHQPTKVELQLKRHGKKSYPSSSSSWKGREKREEKPKKEKSPKKKIMHTPTCPRVVQHSRAQPQHLVHKYRRHAAQSCSIQHAHVPCTDKDNMVMLHFIVLCKPTKEAPFA